MERNRAQFAKCSLAIEPNRIIFTATIRSRLSWRALLLFKGAFGREPIRRLPARALLIAEAFKGYPSPSATALLGPRLVAFIRKRSDPARLLAGAPAGG